MNRLLTLTLSLCLCGAALLAGCEQSVEHPLRIGTNSWPGYQPLHLARSLGYLDEKRLQLIEQISTSETLEAYRNDIVDVAALTLDEVLLLMQTGKPVSIILVLDISHGADVVIARPGINSMSELKGKRVGVEINALGSYMISRALDVNGMQLSEIEIVPLQFQEHENAFLQNTVDAVVTFEPARTRLLKAGGTVVFDSGKIPNEIVDVLVVRPEYLATREQDMRNLVQSWFKALAYMREQREDAAGKISAHQGMKPEEYLSSLEGLQLGDQSINDRLLGGHPPELAASLQRLMQIMVDKGLLSGTVNIEGLINPGLLH